MRLNAAAALIVMLSAPAAAQDARTERIFAPFVAAEPGAHACWRRTYTSDHLAAHPDQLVTDMEFRLAYQVYGAEQGFDEPAYGHPFQLLVSRRGDGRRLEAVGECIPQPNGRIFCGVECDGGGLYLHERAQGKVLVGFEGMWGIALSECGTDPEEGYGEPLLPGKDDKEFLLSPVKDAACPHPDDW